MLDFLKKLIVSNKYSLLVLLILSLWLRLAKDYSIILSYIVLIVLYLIIGIIVGFVLDTIQESKNKKAYSDNDEKPSRTMPREKKEDVSDSHSAIRNHANSVRKVSVATPPKVTSSYIKNADSIPGSVSRRLEKTAATFNSIKQDSDKYAEEEKKFSALYGNTQKSLFENPEELYKNKKQEKDNKPLPVVTNEAETEKEEVKEFTDFSDFSASAADDSEIDEISKEISDRINQSTFTRHRQFAPPKEISFVPKDNVRTAVSKPTPAPVPVSAQTTKANTSPIGRPTNKVQDEPVTQKPVFATRPADKAQVQGRRTHIVRDEQEDKVNADIEKLDRLFNHSRDNDDRAEKKSNSGLFSVFKKKRRTKRNKNS